ncbi:MAG: PLP-dependent aminotransferase family protein [Acidaminococcaceae bacterium]|nr:PLP-dependent aminotransferase family protein [Acidaminococcaceae bacterium]
MHYVVDKKSGKQAYLQLYEKLRHDIVEQVYPYGSKLPSKRMLTAASGVSVITVEHALAILCDEGYAEGRERSGYYVIYKAGDFFAGGEQLPLPEYHGESARSSSLVRGEFPFSVLAGTVRRVVAKYGEALLVRSPNRGCPELRRAVAAYLHRSRGIKVNFGQIIIGAGSEYLYSLLAQLLGREHTFAVEDPSYEKIVRVYEAHRVRLEKLQLGADGILSSALHGAAADVLHVTPYSSFPSGVTATASKRREYADWAESRHGFLIEDDYASEFTISAKSEDTLFSLSRSDNVIYLNSFSKSIAPSLRVGYLLLPERLQVEFDRRLDFYSCTVPVLEQYILTELLNGGDFERHINRMRRKLRKTLVGKRAAL